MDDHRALEKQIISLGERRRIEELQNLVDKTSVDTLTTILSAKLGRSDCITFWNTLLQGFNPNDSASQTKRFSCVKCFLDGLLRVELSYKQTFDLITRLCQDLPTFPSVQLVEVLEHSIEGLRMGDPKCVGWKDLLPETLKILASQSEISVNGVTKTGLDYRNTIVHNLTIMRWPIEVLTPIADMFKELKLTSSETMIVLNKFAGTLQALAPTELPSLAFQLFSMALTSAQVVVIILALEKYFHKHYYKKLFADMCSNSTDFDSIDAYSDRELREAEETVLYHLNYCTQYKFNEAQMRIVMKNFLCLPDVMLTPFMLSAILSMTIANREPDCRLSSSELLLSLRTAIKHNEEERQLAEDSVWCRDCLHRKQVDLEQIFTVLIDHNKEGKDVVTPGLVNMAFSLLRTRKGEGVDALHLLATCFLTKFIRKRFVFARGVVKRIAEWMVVEQEQPQYAECLTLLSVADTFTVSECIKTIQYVMDSFLWISGENALRMMSFILPTLKLSAMVRDAFIGVLRKALMSSDVTRRRMAVYGFCMILKQLNNSNSQRTMMSSGAFGGTSTAAGYCTQMNISGYSLMSQVTVGNTSNPLRHFDMLTLEIIGLLRNCFNHTLDVKMTLYENLQRAVELNVKLVPHVLQFIDWHFRSFFQQPLNMDDENGETALSQSSSSNDIVFAVKFERLVKTVDDNENIVDVHDNLGYIMLFVSHCLVHFEKFELEYNANGIRKLFNMTLEKVLSKELKIETLTGTLTYFKLEMFGQQLNFIEGLIAYSLFMSKTTNDNVKHILPLFRIHYKIYENLKSLAMASRKPAGKKAKTDVLNDASNNTATKDQVNTSTGIVNGIKTRNKPNAANVKNIWDMIVLEKLLRVLHDDVVPFALSEHTQSMRSNVEFVNYVLSVAAQKIEELRFESDYKQLSHSRRMFKYLTDITKVVYERCIRRLPTVWRDFDVKTAALAAECFRECVLTANAVYKKKFADTFVPGFDFGHVQRTKVATSQIQDIIDAWMVDEGDPEGNTFSGDRESKRIPQALFQTLEVLYANLPFDNRLTGESYSWLLHFCQTYVIELKELTLVHRLLFIQRQKTHSGVFFNVIANHLRSVLGVINEETLDNAVEMPVSDLKLKSITLFSAESCLLYLCAALSKQIADADYFITKATNLNYKTSIIPSEEKDICLSSLVSLERSLCSQFVHIANALLPLTNVAIPLGTCMDTLLRLLMQNYVSLKNLVKHFLTAVSMGRNNCIQAARFDLLLRVVGKRLPTNIYELITYIEGNILDAKEQDAESVVPTGARKKPNTIAQKPVRLSAQAQKAKVLRETKLIPKMILCVENFNKHVILLSKRTQDRLATLLHYGTVRDFRIRTTELKAAIERTFTHSSQIEVETSGQSESDETNNENNDNRSEETQNDEEENVLARMESESRELASRGKKSVKTHKSKEKELERAKRTRKSRRSSTNSVASSSSSVEKPRKRQTHRKVGNANRSMVIEDNEDDEEDNNENVDSNATDSQQEKDDEENLANESNRVTITQVMKNMKTINRKPNKRRLHDLERLEEEIQNNTAAVPPVPEVKRRRGLGMGRIRKD